jgi:hypothetical protein
VVAKPNKDDAAKEPVARAALISGMDWEFRDPGFLGY